MDISALAKMRALVVGLGREGSALATYLASHGLQVTATDLQSAAQLGQSAAALQEAGVSLVLGEHPLSLLDEADILFVSPGIPLEASFIEEARSRKIPLCTESKLFCLLCPAPIMAVTGSNGKTTTTTLVAEIMRATGRTVWLGGNIGRPLIEVVDVIGPDDVVLMELSSFQLEYFHAKLNEAVDVSQVANVESDTLEALLGNWSPSLSAILNITPNHLDRHPSMKHYVRAKRSIINYQGRQGHIIMNLDNDMTRTIGNQFGPKTRWFSIEAQMPNGASLVGKDLVLFDAAENAEPIANLSEIKLRGMHNQSNILAACLLSRELGASLQAMRQVVTTFTGVEHRLQFVREHAGASYYNDSIATSPERLVAALRSFNEPIVLLAGGYDKQLPWDDAARLMIHKADHVILFGAAAELIAQAIDSARWEVALAETTVHHQPGLDEAVTLAHQLATVGNVVLLSPGCASFDAYRDYEARGEHFMSLVLGLQ